MLDTARGARFLAGVELRNGHGMPAVVGRTCGARTFVLLTVLPPGSVAPWRERDSARTGSSSTLLIGMNQGTFTSKEGAALPSFGLSPSDFKTAAAFAGASFVESSAWSSRTTRNR